MYIALLKEVQKSGHVSLSNLYLIYYIHAKYNENLKSYFRYCLISFEIRREVRKFL